MLSKYRIPTILGILVLVGGVIGGIFLVGQRQTALFPRAAPEFTPKQVRITNLSENSFNVLPDGMASKLELLLSYILEGSSPYRS